MIIPIKKGRLKDESESIFTYSGGWSFDTFHDNRPIIKEWQRFRPWFTTTEVPFPSNVSFTYNKKTKKLYHMIIIFININLVKNNG